MGFPKKVRIREVGPREGMQIEKKKIDTQDKIKIVDLLSECNFPIIEVTSFVSPKWVPQMADAEEVSKGFKRHENTEYHCVYLNAKGIERAKATGKFDLEGVISITASETFSIRNTNRSIEETFDEINTRIDVLKSNEVSVDTLAVMTVFGCNYEGDVDPKKVIQLIERALKQAKDKDAEPENILLGDTVGWANPILVESLVGTIKDKWPEKSINLHLHDTRGMGIANAYAGLKMGVDYFDSSVGGLGGCPFSGSKGAAGNVVTEDLVHMCHELGIETGIDLEKLIEVTKEIEKILGRSLPSKLAHGGTLSSYRERQ